MIKFGTEVGFDPTRFYGIMDVMESIDSKALDLLERTEKELDLLLVGVDDNVRSLARTNNAVLSEVRQNFRKKHKNAFATDEDPFEDLRHSVDGESFLRVIFDVTRIIQRGYHDIRDVVHGLRPGRLIRTGMKPGSTLSVQDMESFYLQVQMNRASVENFTAGVLAAGLLQASIAEIGACVVDRLDKYYERILHRHSAEGIKVHGDPILTDVAISIYENADASGEIADGKKPDEVSIYSIRKAVLVAEGVKNGMIGELIRNPGGIFKFIGDNLKTMWATAGVLSKSSSELVKAIHALAGVRRQPRTMADEDFMRAIGTLEDLDPRNIEFRDKGGIQTSEERFELGYRNETIGEIVKLIVSRDADAQGVIQYILERKAKLHKYFQEENSFYVCKVGNGNPFTGEAPGMLTVIPGTKPNVLIDEVVGSGFDQIKSFVLQVKEGAKWHDLFVATSPSKSADKANALLVGPQGCGKSEVLRSVGGDRAGIGIYAQPSDFLTCWKGEAEKNPKRLFEAAVKLQKESGKQVFILIDEVDTILNDDHARGGFGATNLTTEFQQLMDGIVQYPHIAVWAATNHPERIPMPMIRRFSKVAVVGELDQAARVKLLKQFVAGYLPLDEKFPERAWEEAAEKLDGAVGDTVRKVADEVWRSKVSGFIRNHPVAAEAVVKFLNVNGKFQIGRFTPDLRSITMNLIRPHARVTPEDVMESVDLHLDNVAIRAEISTAKETYERSKQFLAGIKGRR